MTSPKRFRRKRGRIRDSMVCDTHDHEKRHDYKVTEHHKRFFNKVNYTKQSKLLTVGPRSSTTAQDRNTNETLNK